MPRAYHHHYPVTLLRRWGRGGERAWYYNSRMEPPTPRLTSIQKIFGENDANAFVGLDGIRIDAAESRLSEIESDIYAIVSDIEKFASTRQVSAISARDSVRKVQFLYWNLSLRSPRLRERHAVDDEFYSREVVDSIRAYQALGESFALNAARFVSDAKSIEQTKKLLSVSSISSTWETPPKWIEKFGFLIVTPKNVRKSFIIGPNANTPFSLNWTGTPLNVLVVSPRIALAPFGDASLAHIINLEDYEVRKLNHSIFNQNTELVAVDALLLASLIGAR